MQGFPLFSNYNRFGFLCAGNIISFGLFASPVPTIWRILKKKSVEEFKPDPYIATVMNCLFWIFYGIPVVHPDSTLVVTINSVGLAMELIYLTIFFVYGDNRKRLKIIALLFLEIVFLGAIAAVTVLKFHTHPARSTFVGSFCVAFGVIMYISPLTIMRKVIKTRSVEYMPFYLSLTNFLNGCIWTAYALIKFDLFILISNGMGALSGAVQLIIYACYYNSTPKGDNDAEKPPRSQIELPSA